MNESVVLGNQFDDVNCYLVNKFLTIKKIVCYIIGGLIFNLISFFLLYR